MGGTRKKVNSRRSDRCMQKVSISYVSHPTSQKKERMTNAEMRCKVVADQVCPVPQRRHSGVYFLFGLINGSASFFLRLMGGGGGLTPLPGRGGGGRETYTRYGYKLANKTSNRPCGSENSRSNSNVHLLTRSLSLGRLQLYSVS